MSMVDELVADIGRAIDWCVFLISLDSAYQCCCFFSHIRLLHLEALHIMHQGTLQEALLSGAVLVSSLAANSCHLHPVNAHKWKALSKYKVPLRIASHSNMVFFQVGPPLHLHRISGIFWLPQRMKKGFCKDLKDLAWKELPLQL